MLDIVIERWWIRDSFCPPDLAWRAVILDPNLGVTSAADATPWAAITRAAAHHVLKRCRKDTPLQARLELEELVARARSAERAMGAADPAQAPQPLALSAPAGTRRSRGRRSAASAASATKRRFP